LNSGKSIISETVGKRLINPAEITNREKENGSLVVLDHNHNLKRKRRVARVMCERGYHRLDKPGGPSLISDISEFGSLVMGVYEDIRNCRECRDAYHDEETRRHGEGLVRASPKNDYKINLNSR
jgi:hypothetical protein